jgi:hypothetical protein
VILVVFILLLQKCKHFSFHVVVDYTFVGITDIFSENDTGTGILAYYIFVVDPEDFSPRLDLNQDQTL